MRQKAPFRLYKRQVHGKTIWYYTCYDEYGKRYRVSTGCTSKTTANNRCMEWYRDGNLLPSRATPVLFSEYAKDWWVWGKCPYLTSKLENGYQIGKNYAKTNRSIMTKRILPDFQHVYLHQITVDMVEQWAKGLREDKEVDGKVVKGLSPKSVRNYVGVLSVMLDEAVRLEHIPRNPCKKARIVAKRSRPTGILTRDEAFLIFSDPDKWYNRHGYAANLLASVTGMRLSEIRALQCVDVKVDHVHVERSIADRDGMKTTKTNDVRDLPVPSKVMEELETIKHGRSEGFLFCYPDGKPYGRHMFLDNLKDVLKLYGIDCEERNLKFHSWRHFLNTQLLSHGISGEKTREITGHTTEAMTQRYKHFRLEDYRDVLEVTEEIVRTR